MSTRTTLTTVTLNLRRAGEAVARHRVTIAWILIAAAIALRAAAELLPLLRYTSFYVDQARDAFALEGIRHGHWPTLGPPNSFAGYDLPPTYYYLLLPFALLSLHPAFQNVFNDLAALAVVPLFALVVYRLARRRWADHGQRLLLAGAMALWFSLSWFGYSTSVGEWCPYPIPLFVLLIVLIMDKILALDGKKGEGRYWLALGALVGLSLGLHSIMLVLMPIFAAGFAAYALWRRPRRWQWMFAAAGITALIITPYLVGDAHRGFSNTRQMVQSLFTASAHLGPLDRANRFVAQAHAATDAAFSLDPYHELTALLLGLCVVGTAVVIKLDPRLGWLFAALALLYLASASGYTGPMYGQYFYLPGLLPILAVAALLIDPPRQTLWRWSLPAGIVLVLLVSAGIGARNMKYYIALHYGRSRLMSVSDRAAAINSLPHHAILCTATADPTDRLDYFYIQGVMLRRTDLTIRGDCQSGDYYIYRHLTVPAEPINTNRTQFVLVRTAATYELLRRN
jgi:hypothetical protein